MTPEALLEKAKEARLHAYAPYSGCRVGAALLCADGTVYGGANIENAAYGPTNCAERTAIFTAVYEGKRDFTAIAVVGGTGEDSSGTPFAPCGVCRQVLREFCEDGFEIYLEDVGGVKKFTLTELLPQSFSAKDL